MKESRNGLLETLVEATAKAVGASAVFVTAELSDNGTTVSAEFPASATSTSIITRAGAEGADRAFEPVRIDDQVIAVPVRTGNSVAGWAVAVGYDSSHDAETERLVVLLARAAGVLLGNAGAHVSDRAESRWQDAARDGYWDWDLETGAMRFSRRSLSLLDHRDTDRPTSPDVWLGRVRPDDRGAVLTALLSALADLDGPVDCEHRIVRPDGTERSVTVRALLEYGDTGRPVRLVGWLCDVTAYRLIEGEMRSAYVLADVGRLAAATAHDFNNFLTIIRGHTELALGAVDRDTAVGESLELIKHAAAGATTLTRQLLAVRRRQSTEGVATDLNDAVRAAEQTLRLLAGSAIDLTLRLTPGRTRIRAEPAHIERILINLVVNGRDAMPRGGSLEIATKNVALEATSDPERPLLLPPGWYVTLSVTDTGAGMNEATRASIFQPFFTTKPAGHGTGLGLWIVRDIVERCGGAIDVRSTPGAGTAFVIYFPHARDSVPGFPQS